METEPFRIKLHNKWVAVAVWLALLAALVYTSANGVTLSFGGSLSNYLRFLASPSLTTSDQSASAVILAFCGLAVTLVFVYLSLRAWLRFAGLTHQLVISYAASDRPNGSDSVFYDMLDFDDTDNIQSGDEESHLPVDPDPAASDRSSVSDIVTSLAYTWAILLVAPPLISIVTILFAKPAQ